MKKIMQFRFHGEGSQYNYPKNYGISEWTYNLFDKYGMISHLGIQGAPGTVFYINHSQNPITLGVTGIYELNLEGIGRVNALRFEKDILMEKYSPSDANPYHRLIVDIVYDGAGVSTI